MLEWKKGLPAWLLGVLILMTPAPALAAHRDRKPRHAGRCVRVHAKHGRRRKTVCRRVAAKHSPPARPTATSSSAIQPPSSTTTRHAAAPATTAPTPTATTAPLSWTGWHVLSNPIDPTQQTDLPFGATSDWLQPWRAYLDTPPASRMRNGLGINFNVPPQYAAATAQFLAQVGFKRARLGFEWASMSYADPSKLQDPASWDTTLGALKAAGIRPLIVLNANDGDPGPSQAFSASVTQPAAAGSRTMQVDAATAQKLVPGLSGFTGLDGAAATYIATSVSSSGEVMLSQPLPVSVPAGSYPVTTLRYQPFAPPFTAAGEPNPAFERTLSGWLLYVKAVTSELRKVLGDDQFDIEIWNELSFGSNFLDVKNYYNPVPPALQGVGSVDDELLARTAAWLRDPANGLPDVGIADGFASQSPYVSASSLPAGITALSKHPYYGGINNRPWYQAFFPENLLTAVNTSAFMERDLSPIPSTINGALHSGYATAPGSTTPPQVWITETGFRPDDLAPLSDAEDRHLQAESALRNLSAYINKGVSALYFYAVSNGDWGMVDPTASDGGETMVAIKRFIQAFAGPSTIAVPRSLSLLSIADQGNWMQFAGDGTAAHPPLYNRDVVAFFPFQTDSNRFVIPAYVMTRNMGTLYKPSAPATDLTRYDLPPETYRLTVGGLHTANLTATASDPLTGASVPVQVTATSSTTAVLEIPLTQYPRLITLQDG